MLARFLDPLVLPPIIPYYLTFRALTSTLSFLLQIGAQLANKLRYLLFFHIYIPFTLPELYRDNPYIITQ